MGIRFGSDITSKQQDWRKPSQRQSRRGNVSVGSLRDCGKNRNNTAGTAEINASGDDVRNVVALLQRSVSMKEEAAWGLAKWWSTGKTEAMKRFFLFLCTVLLFGAVSAQGLSRTYAQFVSEYNMYLFETCGQFEVTGQFARLVYYHGGEEYVRMLSVSNVEYTEREVSYQFEDGSTAHSCADGGGSSVWNVEISTIGTCYDYIGFLIFDEDCYGKTAE